MTLLRQTPATKLLLQLCRVLRAGLKTFLLRCPLLRTYRHHLLTKAMAFMKCHITVAVVDVVALKVSIAAGIEAAVVLGAIAAKAVDAVVGVIEAIVAEEMGSAVEDADEEVDSEAIVDVAMLPNRQVPVDPALPPYHLALRASEI